MTSYNDVATALANYSNELTDEINRLTEVADNLTLVNQDQTETIHAQTTQIGMLTAEKVLLEAEVARLQAIIDADNPPPPPPPPPPTGLFPGHVPGRIYYGFSRLDGSATSDVENKTINLNGWDGGVSLIGQPASSKLGVRRLYSKNMTLINKHYADNVMIFLSAKADDFGVTGGTAGWGQVASGAADTGIRSYFKSLVELNKPLMFTFHHEPTGDAKGSNSAKLAGDWCNANRRIISVFEAEYGLKTKIIFTANLEGYVWRSNKTNTTIDLRLWTPEDLLNRWKIFTFDMYHNTTSDPLFSTRAREIEQYFEGTYQQPGTGPASWLKYKIGTNLVLGVGEHAGRYKYFRDGTSKVTAAKWARDAENYLFANPNKYPVVSWFNSIGVEDERLELPKQTGDTEATMDVYREKANSNITIKLT